VAVRGWIIASLMWRKKLCFDEEASTCHSFDVAISPHSQNHSPAPEGNFSPSSSSSLLGCFWFSHLHIFFIKLGLSFRAQKPSLPLMVRWDVMRTCSIPGSSLPTTSPCSSQPHNKQNIAGFSMRTKDGLVLLSHLRTHSERTMPWQAEVQVAGGTTREGTDPEAAAVTAGSITMCHGTEQ